MAPRAPAVILVRPSEEGNIGSTARAMANTGLSELHIVEPAAPLGDTARAFAVGGGSILDSAVRQPSLSAAVAPFHCLVGTSSQRKREPKVPVVTPRALPDLLPVGNQQTALIFGPERSGLTTDELARCHVLVRIPADLPQPTLNLAQAVLLVAHEIFLSYRADPRPAVDPAGSPAPSGDVEAALEHLRRVLGAVGFARDDTFEAVFRDLLRLATRARLSLREVQILRGLMRRTEHALRTDDECSE